MFDLLYLPKTGEKSLISPGQWLTTKRALQENTAKIVNYYQLYPQTISSSHLLIRVIYAMNITKTIPLDRFYNYCLTRTYDTAQTMGLTSATSKGKIWDGVFYGSGSHEIVIVNDEYFDLDMSYQNWKTLQPIRVLHHSKSDLNINIPDGRFTSPEQGMAFLTLNLPMLMVQYYHFTKEQDIKVRDGITRRSIMQFIYSYVLTNMVYSHLDYALFNRLSKLAVGDPPGYSMLRHSFGLLNYTKMVDDSLIIVNEYLKSPRSVKSFEKFLNIPTVSAEYFTDVLMLPRAAPTLQVYWALILSKIKVLSYILRTYENPRRVLGAEINSIQRFLRINNVVESIKSIIPNNDWLDFSEDIAFIQKI